MLPRILGWAVVLATAAVAFVLVWPQAVGLQNQWVAAHVVALRGAAAGIGILFAVCFALFAIAPRTRRFWIAMATVLALFAAGNIAVLAVRGTGGGARCRCRVIRHRHRALVEHARRGARRADDRRPRPR